jgi:hypothetical protein
MIEENEIWGGASVLPIQKNWNIWQRWKYRLGAATIKAMYVPPFGRQKLKI